MLKNVIITVKESQLNRFEQIRLEDRFTHFYTKNAISNLGLIMAQMEDNEIDILRNDPLIESVEEEEVIQLPPSNAHIQ